MGVQIPTHEGAILRANRGRPSTCPALDVLKTTEEEGNTGTVHADADSGVLDGIHIDAI